MQFWIYTLIVQISLFIGLFAFRLVFKEWSTHILQFYIGVALVFAIIGFVGSMQYNNYGLIVFLFSGLFGGMVFFDYKSQRDEFTHNMRVYRIVFIILLSFLIGVQFSTILFLAQDIPIPDLPEPENAFDEVWIGILSDTTFNVIVGFMIMGGIGMAFGKGVPALYWLSTVVAAIFPFLIWALSFARSSPDIPEAIYELTMGSEIMAFIVYNFIYGAVLITLIIFITTFTD